MKILLSTVFILISFNGYSLDSICSNKDASSELSKLIQKTSIESTREKLNKILSNKLVLVGEAHYLTDIKYLKDLIQSFSKSHKSESSSCIAFEFSSAYPNFGSFLKEVDWLIDQLRREFKDIRDTDSRYAEYMETVDYLNNIKSYYGELHHFAVSKGLKTFTVDHPENNFANNFDYEKRNISMAKNLQELFKFDKCSSILYLTGKAHLSSNQGTTNKIQDYLDTNVLDDSATVNLQMTKEDLLPKQYRTWDSCAPPHLNFPIILSSDDLISNFSLVPMAGEPLPLFKDFNFTIMIP